MAGETKCRMITTTARLHVFREFFKRICCKTQHGEANRRDNTIGQTWQYVGASPPQDGKRLLECKSLSLALHEKLKFETEELETFQLGDISEDDYVKCGAIFYKPAERDRTLRVRIECERLTDPHLEAADLILTSDQNSIARAPTLYIRFDGREKYQINLIKLVESWDGLVEEGNVVEDNAKHSVSLTIGDVSIKFRLTQAISLSVLKEQAPTDIDCSHLHVHITTDDERERCELQELLKEMKMKASVAYAKKMADIIKSPLSQMSACLSLVFSNTQADFGF